MNTLGKTVSIFLGNFCLQITCKAGKKTVLCWCYCHVVGSSVHIAKSGNVVCAKAPPALPCRHLDPGSLSQVCKLPVCHTFIVR